MESSDAQLEEHRKKLQEAEKNATEAMAKLEEAEAELKRALPFEKEVREKNLLIGKLRHEAVTLNEHLTKALRFLKKGKPEDNVDRLVLPISPLFIVLYSEVANHNNQTPCHQPLPPFPGAGSIRPEEISGPATHSGAAGMDRWYVTSLPLFSRHIYSLGKPLSNTILNHPEQREQAGLARPGTSSGFSGSLRVPSTSSLLSRTPSSPALASEIFTENGSTRKESLAELWSNFLEREAAQKKESKPRSQSDAPPTSPTL